MSGARGGRTETHASPMYVWRWTPPPHPDPKEDPTVGGESCDGRFPHEQTVLLKEH